MTIDYNAIPKSSPWGEVQYGKVVIDGIITVSTAGHGGVRISPARLREMPEALRLGRRRWFEEDCDAALVAVAFADELGDTESQRETALKSVANYFPEKWEAYTGKTLEPGQSYTRDKQVFEEENRDKFVVKSACGDWHKTVPSGYVGVYALRSSDRTEGRFLVPEDDYHSRSRFGYVLTGDEQVWVDS